MANQKKSSKAPIDCDRINVPPEIPDGMERLLDVEIPLVEPPVDRIKPVAKSLSDERVWQMADRAFNTQPAVTQRRKLIANALAWLAALRAVHDLAHDEARRAFDRLPDRVPRATTYNDGFFTALKSTAASLVSWSVYPVIALSQAITAYLFLEIIGTQVLTLINSKETWAQSPITALSFSIAFSLAALISTRNYCHLRATRPEDDFGRVWAWRFLVAAWTCLTIFGGFLGCLSAAEWGLLTGVKLFLAMAGPQLLAGTCLVIENWLDEHRRRLFESTLIRNEALRGSIPELTELGADGANLDCLAASADELAKQVEEARLQNREQWNGVRDDLRRVEIDLDELQRLEREKADLQASADSNELQRRQLAERIRLYDPDRKLPGADEDDEDDDPGVVAKMA